MNDRVEARVSNAEHWTLLREAFEAALQVESRERGAISERYFGESPALERELGSLLAAHEAASGFLEPTPGSTETIVDENERFIGRQLGAYRIVGELGRGGMGVVYLATRDDGVFDRRVAIKLLPPSWVAKGAERRFKDERRILASMDHANIASLLDGGSTEEGVLYLVMEYVDGLPIDRFHETRELPIRRRVDLFIEVCNAVHYAHQRLVIHRDIKPGNILVTDQGTPKLLDFGIAKFLDNEDWTSASPASRHFALTPEYASPEQIRGEPVTTASDVYSLGILLYRLLSGRHPYALPGYSPFLTAQAACETRPLPPSKRVDKPKCRDLEGDLDAICLRAIEKLPGHRYGSVAEFVKDLENFLEHRPVEARSGPATYRAGRFLRRHRWGASVVAVFVAMGVLFVLLTSQERNEAEKARVRAERVTQILSELLTTVDPWSTDPKNQTTSSFLSAATEQVMSEKLDEDPRVRADLLSLLGEINFKIGLIEEAETLLDEAQVLYDEICPEDCSELVDVLIYRGNVEESRRAFEAAEDFYQRALALSRQRLGETHYKTGHAHRALGHLRHHQGEIGEAERFFLRALEIFSEVSGPGSAEVASSLGSLGGVLWSQGRRGEATDHYRRALAIQIDVLEPDHPNIAQTRSSLGSLIRAEDPERALQHLRLALATIEKHLVEGHERIGTFQNNLGGVLLELDRYEEAERVLRKAAQSNRHSLLNLAEALEGLGRYEEALHHYQAAYELYTEFWGGLDLPVGVVLSGLAGLYRKMGDVEQCEEKAQESLERLRRVEFRPGEAPFLAEAKAILGSCLVAKGQFAEGEALLLDSLEPLTQDRRRRGALRRLEVLRELAALAEAREDHDRAEHYGTLLDQASRFPVSKPSTKTSEASE